MNNITAFDRQTPEYDAWFEKNNDCYQAELEALHAFIPATGQGVEIGVGTGRFAAPLGISVGVEPALRMAELARQRGITVLEGVAEALPFADDSFDFAVMVTVVCFLDDLDRAFREACRILKPHGTLVIGFIDRESELGQHYSRKKKQSRFYRDAIFYSASELEALLTKAGFSGFVYRQTLVPGDTNDLTAREGHGSGGFVVMQAHKANVKETSMKVGIIRCQLTEDMCPGSTDFKVAREGTLAFAETGPVEIIGFLSCGGCSGKKAVTRARMMVDRGAEAIVFASCMKNGNPIGYPCPHFAAIKGAVEKKLGDETKIIDWTH